MKSGSAVMCAYACAPWRRALLYSDVLHVLTSNCTRQASRRKPDTQEESLECKTAVLAFTLYILCLPAIRVTSREFSGFQQILIGGIRFESLSL
jgi:hypothetical protein